MTLSFKDSYSKLNSRYLLSSLKKDASGYKSSFKLGGLSDDALKSLFRSIPPEGRLKGTTLHRALAIFHEACKRTLQVSPYETQILGLLCLLRGRLAEMKTGEGKTLTVAGAAALAALSTPHVHVMTANAYLAQRDSELMRPLFERLGLTVGHIHETMTKDEKRLAYGCNVVYGVSHEFGFDYLKDNLRKPGEALVNPHGLKFALIDEVDSVLLDDARTPMVISKSEEGKPSLLEDVAEVVREFLIPSEHIEVNLKERSATLNNSGFHAAEKALMARGLIEKAEDLYSPLKAEVLNAVNNAVTVKALYREGRDFVVREGKVQLVDAGTGRPMADRRLSDGVHEALEAFSEVAIGKTTKIQGSLTYQSFFGMYDKLAGLTGTAATEADEFAELYGLEVVVVPPNRPSARIDHSDLFFATKGAKYAAIVEAVKGAGSQPVLVGAGSVRDAEILAGMLSREGLTPSLLTAKHAEKEAAIIAKAGEPGAITVATNMAGRGTDIILGGVKPQANDEQGLLAWEARRAQVLAEGGLFVLGAERNWTRRVDNQLAGRAGRQGEPGLTQFFVSMEDETLVALASSKSFKKLSASWLGQDGVASKTISAFVTAGQKKFEEASFAERRELLQYDKALAAQRKTIYALRENLLAGELRDKVEPLIQEAFSEWSKELEASPDSSPEFVLPLKREFESLFGISLPMLKWATTEDLSAPEMAKKAQTELMAVMNSRLPSDDAELRGKLIAHLDELWAEHLTFLESLKSSVKFRAKIGVNPIFEFQKEAFSGFSLMLSQFSRDTATLCLAPPKLDTRASEESAAETRVRQTMSERFVARNEPCPCGSGIAFKHCHGSLKRKPLKTISEYSADISSRYT